MNIVPNSKSRQIQKQSITILRGGPPINDKTMSAGEIVAALRCHINDKSCTDCHYHNGVTCEPKRLTDDAADLIEAQQAELACVTAERDALKPSAEVLEAIDELVEFARTRMTIGTWLGYANVLGEWRSPERQRRVVRDEINSG